MTERERENREKNWDRYTMRKAVRLAREKREKTLVGKTVKEVKRRVALAIQAIDRVRETIPAEPWNSEDWMDM